MKNSAILTALVAGLCASLSSFAQVPASAPAGTTGLCKDGSFTTSASKKGTCQGHKGVKTWYGTAAASTASTSTANPTPAATAGNKVASTAAGGGPGQVWVNTRTKVYHCAGDKAYGKTKQGQYLTEAAARAAGDHPAHGKTCS